MPKIKGSDPAKPGKEPTVPKPKPEVPNATTREAIAELERGGGTRHASVKEMVKKILG